MARLNEPPAPVESNLDILRRKFMRQNRDLARVNSHQSSRIRALESDYARLLSENLGLRGQVMRLEKELENDTARRVADQAMEMRAKLEAKLAELGSMLATFGDEPPAKRHAPERRTHTSSSPQGIRKSAQRKPREKVDQDALAAQEGRLPPIYENKPVARATMNSVEIMALCAEAANTSYSPDIGPPPVLRSIDESPSESSSPTKSLERSIPRKRSQDDIRSAEIVMPPSKPDSKDKVTGNSEPTKELGTASIRIAKMEKVVEADKLEVPTPSRAGAKRKFGDENETAQAVKPQSDKAQLEKENGATAMGNERPFANKGRVIKDASVRKEVKASNKTARPPLSAKSANEDVFTPRKAPQNLSKTTKTAKPSQQMDDVPTRKREKKPASAPIPTPVLELHIPPPSPEPPIAVTAVLPDSLFEADPEPEPELETSGPSAIVPDTPERSAPRDTPADTPPPGYLALNGETARPSRRARSAVSYAEPNLRDKMRRPTKELFDAVAGEGKFKQRASTNAAGLGLSGGTESAPTSTVKPVSETTGPPRETVAPSPSVQREVSLDTAAIPGSNAVDPRKRPSAVGVTRDQLPISTINFDNIPKAPPPKQRPSPQETYVKPAAADDIYDFSTTSPGSAVTSSSESKELTTKPRRQQLRRASAAAAHQALRDYAATNDDDGQAGASASKFTTASRPNPRKRASMQAPKRTPLTELTMVDTAEGGGDASMTSSFSSLEDVDCGNGEEEPSQREKDRRKRVDRRRSMML